MVDFLKKIKYGSQLVCPQATHRMEMHDCIVSSLTGLDSVALLHKYTTELSPVKQGTSCSATLPLIKCVSVLWDPYYKTKTNDLSLYLYLCTIY